MLTASAVFSLTGKVTKKRPCYSHAPVVFNFYCFFIPSRCTVPRHLLRHAAGCLCRCQGNADGEPSCYTYFKKTIHSLTKIYAIFAGETGGGRFCGSISAVCVNHWETGLYNSGTAISCLPEVWKECFGLQY